MIAKLGWMIQKDLRSEFRAWRVSPSMLLLGLVVALVFGFQADLIGEEKQRIAGGLLWLAIFFAGMQAIDRSWAAEREEGCWQGLRLYPVSPTFVFLAKFVVNVIALAAVEALLFPVFAVIADMPIASQPGAALTVAVLGNLAISAAGTLCSAAASGTRRNSGLLVFLVLPLVIPVLLAAGEATRLAGEDRIDGQWWRWVEVLAASSIVFLAAGTVLFDYVFED